MRLSIPEWLLKFAAVPMFILAALAVGCEHDTGVNEKVTPSSGSAAPAVVSSDSKTQQVNIDNFSFNPPLLTVAAGTTVTWTNRDDVPHTVTANDGGFDSKALDTDEHFSHQFTAPGTYAYFCRVHNHMTGQIIVK